MQNRTAGNQFNLPLCDAHCHLDFYDQPERVAAALCARNITLFSMTMNPQTYRQLSCQLNEELMSTHIRGEDTFSKEAAHDSAFFHNASTRHDQQQADTAQGCCSVVAPAAPVETGGGSLHLGLGMHPWEVSDLPASKCAQQEMLNLVNVSGKTSAHQRMIIGEVGLDFSQTYRPHARAQERFFTQLCQALEKAAPALLSLHAVASAAQILDVLETLPPHGGHRYVLHWFSGSGDDLVRARRLGCYFSVNTRMLASRRGRAYAAQIPLTHLLLETDGPCRDWKDKTPQDCAQAHEHDLYAAAQMVAQIHSVSLSQLLESIPSPQDMLQLDA